MQQQVLINTLQHTATQFNTSAALPVYLPRLCVRMCVRVRACARVCTWMCCCRTSMHFARWPYQLFVRTCRVCVATHCNTLQHTATHCKLQHTAKHCNALQHTATHCNTLRRTTTHCDTLQEQVSRGTSFWRISRFDFFDISASAQAQRSWSFTQ